MKLAIVPVVVAVVLFAPRAVGAVEAAEMRDALDAFERALDERWSYLQPSAFDHRGLIAALRARVDRGISEDAFIIELQRVIGSGIDAHASVDDWERILPRGYLPFLIEPVGERFVAFQPDRTAFVDPDHPYVESLDGKPIVAWLDAASAFVPNGSPQYVRRDGLRLMRAVQFLRAEMGLKAVPTVNLTLRSRDGAGQRALQVPIANRLPVYGIWPREERRPALPEGIAYLRLATMSDDVAIPDLAGARGLIIDVRDNGGGRRDALRALAPRLMRPTDPPRVVNAAVARNHPDHDAQRMNSRFLYPENWDGWNAAEREAIASFKKTFRPAWPVPADGYGAWHYTLISPDKASIDKPVVVLMNGKCFSATDVFLSGLKGLPNVTLLGTPSAGGSANVNTVQLADTAIRVRLGTIVSFQSSGKLFDGVGVEPDVLVDPAPEFFIGGRDNQLEAAVDLIVKRFVK
jgi:hypothetical protein